MRKHLKFFYPVILFVFLFNISVIAQDNAPGWKPVDITGENINYIGRWVKHNNSLSSVVMESMWSGAYMKIGIDGGSLKIKLDKPIRKIHVRINNDEGRYYEDINDEITIGTLPKGNHTIRIAAVIENTRLHVKGIEVQEGNIIKPEVSPVIIEYIGNSITAGGSSFHSTQTSYGTRTSELLDAENVMICTSGIMLVSGINFQRKWMIGMEDAYFRTSDYRGQDNNWYLSNDGVWNFTDYQPDIVVVNIGTNDRHMPFPHKHILQQSYIRFLIKIREKNPDAKIVILPTFLECDNEDLRNLKPYIYKAFETAKEAGVNDLYFVDTEGWISRSDLPDLLHPDDNGHIKIANILASTLRPIVDEIKTKNKLRIP